VVEDHPRQRAVLRAMMESWRFAVTEATGTDVREVTRAAREGGAPFGMVLLDGNLPGQDSVELAIELRAEHPALALVLLPASGQTIDPRREGRLGTYGHVAKPVLASTLLETVQALLSGGVITRPDRTTAVTAAVGRSLRILVAEDNPVNRKLILRILEKMGHQPMAVEDGRKALAALAGGGFDLVLMDVQMPGMDGFEATRVLRASEAGGGRRLPVIALTAQAMKGDRELCLAAGMDGYVAKPIDRQELFTAIERALADGIEAPPPVTRPEGVAVPPPIAAEALAPVFPVPRPDAFDRAELLDRTEGDPGMLSELVSLFLRGLPDAVAVLQRAIETHDARALERGAHALRGALLNLSAHPASALAKQLEDGGRHDDFGPVQDTFALLRGELGRLRAELEYTSS
jgi:two-component system sensor histidine kinase/response regulator